YHETLSDLGPRLTTTQQFFWPNRYDKWPNLTGSSPHLGSLLRARRSHPYHASCEASYQSKLVRCVTNNHAKMPSCRQSTNLAAKAFLKARRNTAPHGSPLPETTLQRLRVRVSCHLRSLSSNAPDKPVGFQLSSQPTLKLRGTINDNSSKSQRNIGNTNVL